MKFPEFDPFAIHIYGEFGIRWYGLAYLAAFIAGWWLLRIRARRLGEGWTNDMVGDLVFYVVLGIILGGRFGYVFFYSFDQFLDNPLWLFMIWKGGMSFHGGLLGVLTVFALYGRKVGKTFFEIADLVAPTVPVGLGFGRIANFINGELYGRVTDVPWGMIFPGEDLPRHPSQLYQAVLEGFVLFAILWWFSVKPRPRMAVSGLFLLGYGCFRFIIEFVRQPDQDLGFIAFNWLTMGQVLSLPMVFLGVAFLIWAYRQQQTTSAKN